MSRLATVLMFVSWLLYGAMPAVGMPSIMPASTQQMSSAPAHSAAHDHSKMAATAKAEHSHGNTQQPCPHGGKTCVTPFCAACLTLLPEIVAGDDSPFAHSHPAPDVVLALVYPALAPLTPPPRA
jgi:hypothetical protein